MVDYSSIHPIIRVMFSSQSEEALFGALKSIRIVVPLAGISSSLDGRFPAF
jgi:hypothetical protein